jgi:OHCU decarboxylase
MARYGAVFEHSPWIAEAAWDSGLDSEVSAADLHRVFERIIREAPPQAQLALLNAHPELAVGVRKQRALTEASQSEQRGAGLDRCSPEEFAEFRRLNAAYREKFGFPFIMAVKGFDRGGILAALKSRLARSRDEEFLEALGQVSRIGKFRIDDRFGEGSEP